MSAVRCGAVQCSDQTICACGNGWDTNDIDPPACKPLPALWIIESSKTGAWSTNKSEVALKHMGKSGTVVTPYISKLVLK